MSVRQSRIRDVENQRCSRRDEGPNGYPEGDTWQRGRWPATQADADAEIAEFMAGHPNGSTSVVVWPGASEQPRVCSYCGGIHPDDAAALIAEGWEVDATTKSYKGYLEPPGMRAFHARLRDNGYSHDLAGPVVRAVVPPVKLYVQHFAADQIEAFNAAVAKRRGVPL